MGWILLLVFIVDNQPEFISGEFRRPESCQKAAAIIANKIKKEYPNVQVIAECSRHHWKEI